MDNELTPEKIKEFRLNKGWSQRKVAEKIGTTNLSVWKWENGLARPSTLLAIKLRALMNDNEDSI
jgi:transcriptional regulator with XRE-family HTH domain